MRESQYIDTYLDAARDARLTPGTYLRYTLCGKAAQYSGSYRRALMRAIHRRVRHGTVVAVRSAHNSVAYIRVTDADTE